MGRITKKFSFLTGAVREKDLAYLLAVQDSLAEEKVPHGVIFQWHRRKWGQQNLKWSPVAACVPRKPKAQLLAVGEWGDAFILGSGDSYGEKIKDGNQDPKRRGSLRCAREIQGSAYVAGMDRQVYRRQGKNRWKCLDAGMRPKAGSGDVVGFESIDGFSEKDIYAVGWDGCIWHFDGKKWRELDSPTSVILSGVCCGGDGNVYACGQKGVLLRGRENQWEMVDHGKKLNLFGAAWFRGMLYVSSQDVVYSLKKDVLKLVNFSDDPPGSACHLSAADGRLWSIGAKDVMAFDGKRWSRIE